MAVSDRNIITEGEVQPLHFLARFYIYAIHGYVTEVMFTALWEFCVSQDLRFHGFSSVWSLFIHGIGTMMIEQLSLRLRSHIPLFIRGFIYLTCTYIWEFSSGYILKYFNACPWDYTHFDGSFMGLITLEYAPLWFIGSLVCDKVLIRYTRKLYIGPSVYEERVSYGARHYSTQTSKSLPNSPVLTTKVLENNYHQKAFNFSDTSEISSVPSNVIKKEH